MQVGNNLGFSGNYCIEFKTSGDAESFENKLNNFETKMELKKAGRGKYDVTRPSEPKKVIVRTDNGQFSLSDKDILDVGFDALKNGGSNESINTKEFFNKNAIDIKV